MSEIRDNLKKILMAGLETVGSSLDKAQEALADLAGQGKDSLEQAAAMVRQAFEEKPPETRKEDLLSLFRTLPLSALRELRGQLDALIAAREEEEAAGRPALPGETSAFSKDSPDDGSAS